MATAGRISPGIFSDLKPSRKSIEAVEEKAPSEDEALFEIPIALVTLSASSSHWETAALSESASGSSLDR